MKSKKQKIVLLLTIILVTIGIAGLVGILGMQRYLDNFCLSSPQGGFRSYDYVKEDYDKFPSWLQEYFIKRTKKNLESKSPNQRYKALIALNFLVNAGLVPKTAATIGYELDMQSPEEAVSRDFRYAIFVFGNAYKIPVMLPSKMAQKYSRFLQTGLDYSRIHTDSRLLFFPCLVGLMSANRNDAKEIQNLVFPLLKTGNTRERHSIYAMLVRVRVAHWNRILEKAIATEPDKKLKKTFADILQQYKQEKDNSTTEQDFLFSDGVFPPFKYENEEQ